MNYLSFALSILLCFGCQQNGSHSEKALSDCSDKLIRLMAEEYALHPIASQDKERRGLNFDFYHYGKAETLEARLILHHAAKEILSSAQKRHFSIQDIQISITFLDPVTHKPYEKESLSHASLLGGTLHYIAYEPAEGAFECILKESYTNH